MTDPTRSFPTQDMTAASDTDLALDLAAEYQVAVEAGQPADLAVICKDRPDLIPAVADVLRDAGLLADFDGLRNRVGRYELEHELGQGAFGVAYRARDTLLEREVAVKLLLRKWVGEATVVGRFLDEARITAQLQHPAIPAVHEVGEYYGRPWMAMKLVKGETLAALLKARPDATSEHGKFVAVFEAICQGIAYAHAHNVIHRDLKPANVMVGAFGEVQVMDWGLAKVLPSREEVRSDSESTSLKSEIKTIHEGDQFTQAGAVLGTPAYMAPEQAIAAHKLIDERSDVFSLGGILCAILTGKPPFVGTNSETTRQLAAQGKVQDAFARLDASGADPELVTLCKRCLAPDRADRPASGFYVSLAVASQRVAAAERARQAELDRARAELRAQAEVRERELELQANAANYAAERQRQEAERQRSEAERIRADETRAIAKARAEEQVKTLAAEKVAVEERRKHQVAVGKTIAGVIVAMVAIYRLARAFGWLRSPPT